VSTVLFAPESAYGPTNNCIGIGDVLRRQGHRVVFAAERSWQGKLAALGFEEDLVDLAPPADDEQEAGQFWADFIRDTAPEFRKPTIEQLGSFIVPTWQALVDGAQYCEAQLQAILARTRPHVVVCDNVVSFPALLTHGVPYVRIMSCNPLEIPGPNVPPKFSGYPIDGDRTAWDVYRAEVARTHGDLWSSFDAFCRSCGAPGLPELELMHESPDLNLYLYPSVADYTNRRPMAPTWHRLESSVRATDAPFAVPESLRDGPGRLIYLSLGSLGSADIALMERLVEVLGKLPHRFIVSKGPQHDQYELADNMWGEQTLPQTSILPLVDLVITHGGNNTTTECFHFGKPMIVLPIFWDQYDNAQRVHETGFGVRLDTYTFTDADMSAAIERLLADDALATRLAAVSSGVRASRGTERAAALIAGLARDRVGGGLG
jgi:MGT family glycosyltransferase